MCIVDAWRVGTFLFTLTEKVVIDTKGNIGVLTTLDIEEYETDVEAAMALLIIHVCGA